MAECTACCLSKRQHSCPCRTEQWCIQPSMYLPQWPLPCALEERVDFSPQFNPSGGQYYTTEQALHSWLPLSLMPRRRISEPCKDQNINGTSKDQSFSFLYCPDLYISTDQACFWTFPEVLTRSTKILTQRFHYQCNVLLSPLALESCLPLSLGWLICHMSLPPSTTARPSATVVMTPKEEVQPSPDTTCPQHFTLTFVIESLYLKILRTWTSQVHSI